MDKPFDRGPTRKLQRTVRQIMTVSQRQIIVKRPGGHQALTIEQTAARGPGPNQVQVDVKACGINFADIAVRLGLYGVAKGLYPLCPGLEFSGVVREVGDGITEFSPGQKVFGATRFGAYTTLINCPPEHLWPMPEGWDFERGATFPVAYLTAYYALYQVGHLKISDKVLIHSAAGGVGTAILHLLRLNGNFSVGVVGAPEKVNAALEAGADHVIDKSSCDLWKKAEEISPEGYDIVLDANGAATLMGSFDHLRPTGRLLIYGFASMFSPSGKKNIPKLLWYYLKTPRFSPFDLTSSNKSVAGFNLIYLFDHKRLFRQIMDKLLRWDVKGLLPPMPITAYPFDNVGQAHKDLESGKTVGKLVLKV